MVVSLYRNINRVKLTKEDKEKMNQNQKDMICQYRRSSGKCNWQCPMYSVDKCSQKNSYLIDN